MKLTPNEATETTKADRLQDRYASAFYQQAVDDKKVDVATKDLETLKGLIGSNAEFARTLKDPRISRTEKTNAVRAVAKAIGLDALTANFLGVIGRNRRLAMLSEIIEAFYEERGRKLGETTVHVTSAQPLSELQIKQLSTQLTAKHGGKINIVSTVNPKLIGGFTLQIGSLLYDFSIQTKLARLARNLTSAR